MCYKEVQSNRMCYKEAQSNRMLFKEAQSNRMCYKDAQSKRMSILGEGIECLVRITLHTLTEFIMRTPYFT